MSTRHMGKSSKRECKKQRKKAKQKAGEKAKEWTKAKKERPPSRKAKDKARAQLHRSQSGKSKAQPNACHAIFVLLCVTMWLKDSLKAFLDFAQEPNESIKKTPPPP